MKIVVLILSIFAAGRSLFPSVEASNFINLDFESAPLIQQSLSEDISAFLPGWEVFSGGSAVRTISVNQGGNLGNAGSAILINRFNTFGAPFEGRHSLVLDNGFFPTRWELAQTGIVPESARSLWFKSYYEPFSLRANEEDLMLYSMGTSGGFHVFAADMTPYVGQTARLSFYTGTVERRSYGIDSIEFNSVIVPEPTLIRLFLLAGLFFGCWRSAVNRSKE